MMKTTMAMMMYIYGAVPVPMYACYVFAYFALPQSFHSRRSAWPSDDYDDDDDLSVCSLGSRSPAQLPRSRIRDRRLQRKTT